MIYRENYWVQKRYQRTCDGAWMLFIWGLTALSMREALDTAARKPSTDFLVTEVTPTCWQAFDKEASIRYVVEKRDDKPTFYGENTSYRDQTSPPKPERKKMPEPMSLF